MRKHTTGGWWTKPSGTPTGITLASAVSGTTTGLFLSGSALFFTHYAGFSAAEVAFATSIGGLVAVLARLPLGRLADRRGGAAIWIAGTCLQALIFVLYIGVNTSLLLVLAFSAESLGAAASSAGRNRNVADIDSTTKSEIRAYMRVVFNCGIALGSLIAALIAALPRENLPGIVIVASIACSLEAIIVWFRLLRMDEPTTSRQAKSSTPVIRNSKILVLGAINTVVSLQAPLFSVILPLLIVTQLNVPGSMVAACVVINLIIVLVLQIRLSRGIDQIKNAALAQRRGGILLALGVLGLSATKASGDFQIIILVVSVLLLSIAEIEITNGTWAVGYILAPRFRAGEYLSIYALGGDLAWMIGPVLLIGPIVYGGLLGPVVLALILAAFALLLPRVIIWAWKRSV